MQDENPNNPVCQGAFNKERGQPCPRGDRSGLLETRGQGCLRCFVEILERNLPVCDYELALV
jgi:hypothetical protein